MNLDKYIDFIIRQSCGCMKKSSTPITLVEGKQKPELKGNRYYWTTLGGKPITYPNAYHWPKVYHSSTLHIEVGKDWKPLIPKGMRLSRENGLWKLTRLSDGMD